ncbi:recombination regulator RecX [Chitinimonas sp.]|uniref:recombination regulator RecX n=1 Tax=Chitinimonas sp. TaxID=1934313 RepID=UPI0035AEE48D
MAEPPSLKARAIALLARREHSRAELRRKLRDDPQAGEQLDTVLDELAQAGWQSDARFASAYVHDHLARHGRHRLQAALRERGIADALIAEALATVPEGQDEISRARDIWTRKFGQRAADSREWAKQARFLQSRGFGHEVIRRLLGEQDD